MALPGNDHSLGYSLIVGMMLNENPEGGDSASERILVRSEKMGCERFLSTPFGF